MSLPKKHLEVIPEFKVVVEKLQSPLLLQLILITIPKTELDVIYELIHVRQRQDLLKTHLDRDKGGQEDTMLFRQQVTDMHCCTSDGFDLGIHGKCS